MSYEAAPFRRRLAARILDLAFCLVLTFVVAVPVAVLLVPFALLVGDVGRDLLAGWAAALCYFIAYVGLEVFLLVRREGQTLGKGLFGIRVVQVDEWARPGLSRWHAVVRMLLIFLPFVFLSAAGSNPDNGVLAVLVWLGLASFAISLLMAALPFGKRRVIHDFAAGSRVVRAAKRKIDLRTDLPMLMPGRVDLTKR